MYWIYAITNGHKSELDALDPFTFVIAMKVKLQDAHTWSLKT